MKENSLVDEIKESLNIANDNEKFLLNYSLIYKKVNNYETIAILFEYFPKETIILDVFPFLRENLDHIFTLNIMKLRYYLNESNTNNLKNLQINFYQFLLFIESFISTGDIINAMGKIEKMAFYFYIQIIIFEITPQRLINFVENNFIIEEIELFIILSLYEIKRTPIISIEKYFPKFYSKVFAFYQNFKQLNIYQLNLKQSFDIKFIENFKNTLKTNDENLEELLDHSCIYHLSYILNKEYNLNLNLEQNYSIEKYILDLVQNDNIEAFYDSNKNDEFFSSLQIQSNIIYKEMYLYYEQIIYSLLDFDKTSSIIIQNCSKKNITEYKELFIEYINYLQSIQTIYNHSNINKFENKNLICLNFLDKDLSNEEKNHLYSLKNSIKIDKIKYYIFKIYEELNMHSNDFYISIKNWIDNSINKKEIKELENISIEKIDIMPYFNYLNLICNTILGWFKVFEQIDKIFKFKNYEYNNNTYNNFQSNIFESKKSSINIAIEFIKNNNKEIAKNKFSKCLYSLGLDFLKNKKEIKDDIENYSIKIFFYFDEQTENFYETTSNMNLIIFLNHKINFICEFIFFKIDDKIIYLNDEKHIKNLFEDLYCLLSHFKGVFKYKLFEPFVQKYLNQISIYLSNTADIYDQPKINDYEYFIKKEFEKYVYNNLYPFIDFNFQISAFSNDFKWTFKYFIDFSNIINPIINTKYHPKNKLNSLFQIRAINYIINGDSYIHNFIEELYIRKLLKAKRYKFSIKTYNKINEFITLNIIEGKKYTNNDLKELIKINNINLNSSENIIKRKNSTDTESSIFRSTNSKNKKIKYKLKKPSQIFYSIVSINNFKRKNEPIAGFQGHIPRKEFVLGNLSQTISNEMFSNKIIIKDKYDFKDLKTFKIKNGRKMFVNQDKKENKFINIFDLIFNIKNYSNNIIELEINDISEIINYYSNEDLFLSLLNYNFPLKTKEEIIDYLKNLKFDKMKI